MRKEDLLEMQKKQLRGESYANALSGYLDIVEHYVFIGNILKAKRLMVKLGFQTKVIKKYILSIIKKYDDDESNYLRMIIKGKIKRKLLN